ncbi:MAG: patatin-like phospholipase family protein [Flavobacteriales bacterium]|nr:patatin-like phospholipase family protein [Flavobacteriales bacterium]
MEFAPFVLSGGGVRGAAHAGVLHALQERGIKPEAISATSAGAIVGAMIADGYSPDELIPLLRDELRKTSLLRFPKAGSTRLASFLKKQLKAVNIEDLNIPMFITVTDLERGGQVILDKGALVPALMASSAIPVIFPPVKVNGSFCVDGGLSNNLPVEPFAERKKDVIAVYVNPLPPFDPDKRGTLSTMDRVWHINFREMVVRSAQGCRVFIEPPGLTAYGMFDLRKLRAIEKIGYDHARDLDLPKE